MTFTGKDRLSVGGAGPGGADAVGVSLRGSGSPVYTWDTMRRMVASMGNTVSEVEAWFQKNHPAVCGHPAGYRQTHRVKKKLIELGVPESELPDYDEDCRKAWADKEYLRRRKQPVVAGPSVPREHGTKRGRNQHYAERAKLRRQGVPAWRLPPVCPACRRAGDGAVGPRQVSPLAPLPGENAEHGTEARVEYELLMRRRLRREGAPEEECEAVFCDTCRKAARRRRVKNRVARATSASS